ncbi:unnamed protein product [Umbelopsis vinacea]
MPAYSSERRQRSRSPPRRAFGDNDRRDSGGRYGRDRYDNRDRRDYPIPAIETIVVIDERVQRENLETRENRIPPIQGLLSVTM